MGVCGRAIIMTRDVRKNRKQIVVGKEQHFDNDFFTPDCDYWLFKTVQAKAVVVARLAEQSVPTPEIRGLNPNIGKILSINFEIGKRQKEIMRLGWAHLKKLVQAHS